jgi:hypothetical protein
MERLRQLGIGASLGDDADVRLDAGVREQVVDVMPDRHFDARSINLLESLVEVRDGKPNHRLLIGFQKIHLATHPRCPLRQQVYPMPEKMHQPGDVFTHSSPRSGPRDLVA